MDGPKLSLRLMLGGAVMVLVALVGWTDSRSTVWAVTAWIGAGAFLVGALWLLSLERIGPGD